MKFHDAIAGRTLHLPESSSQSQHVHRDKLRRRAGSAYARIDATGTELAKLIGVYKSTLSNRKQGQGPLTALLLEIDAWERANHDTTPLLEAVLETQIEARGGVNALCIQQLVIEEQQVDAEEDAAGVAYLAKKGSAEAWARQLLAYAARIPLYVRALRQEGAR